MTAAAALVLYPSWAISVVLAATAARLGRSTGLGLLAVCGGLAAWITTVILVELPATRGLAEHVAPFGLLQAGAYVHAGLDIAGRRPRAALVGYGWGVAVGVIGAWWPRGLYGPDLVGAGPLFWPIAAASAVGAAGVMAWLAREARARRGGARRQMVMLSAGNLCAIAAGGGAVLLRVVGVSHDLRLSAPVLLAAVLVIGGAVIRGEVGAARRVIVQTLAYSAMAAAITAVGIALLTAGLPMLSPGPAIGWTLFVAGIAALPLDAVRTLIVDGIGRRLFAAPIGVRDLAEAAERLEIRADHAARLAELGALVSAVAHEVRNPLGVISAHAKLLERAGAPEASVAAVRAQVQRASRFVDDLLAYGKPRPLVPRELDVRAVIDEAVAAVRAVHAGAAIDIEVDRQARLVGDRAALVDVLVNVIGNAAIAVADAAKLGGARAPGRIAIAARRARGLELVVADTGGGVPRELVARLFEPFVTGRGRDHAHPGTGLGLAIARGIVERHGGSLRHEPLAEGGARFVIRLPDD